MRGRKGRGEENGEDSRAYSLYAAEKHAMQCLSRKSKSNGDWRSQVKSTTFRVVGFDVDAQIEQPGMHAWELLTVFSECLD